MTQSVAPTEFAVLNVPRGKKGMPSLPLNMTEIYKAENRLHEISLANNGTAPELMGYFNTVTNLTTKFISWLEYEIMQATKEYENARAVVILDKMPDEMQKYKDAKMKTNEDFRSALIARDLDCQAAREVLDQLVATKTLLEHKARSFVRAYNAAKAVWDRRSSTPVPNFNNNMDDHGF